MVAVSVVVDASAAPRKLNRVGVAIQKELGPSTLRAALHLEGVTREVVMTTFTRNPTGNLARSYKATLIRTGKQSAAGVYSDAPHARIHDRGGTIKPRTGKNLPVPLSARARNTRGLWPRHWPKGQLFMLRSKAGKILLASRGRGRRAKLIFHYVLKPSVQISGKQYLRAAVNKARSGIAKILGDSVRLAVEA